MRRKDGRYADESVVVELHLRGVHKVLDASLEKNEALMVTVEAKGGAKLPVLGSRVKVRLAVSDEFGRTLRGPEEMSFRVLDGEQCELGEAAVRPPGHRKSHAVDSGRVK